MRHYFVPQMITDKPESDYRIAWQHELVSLQQRGPDDFLVRYGKEVHAELTYGQACRQLGRCLFHQFACSSEIDGEHTED